MNAETTIRTIPVESAGQRLDQALARLFPEYSRSRLKAWLLDGAITVDGERPRPRDRVTGGEQVVLVVTPEKEVVAAPEPIALDVVYEDDSLVVINKPAGLVVHPGAGNPTGTLLNGLLHHSPQLEQLPRAGIIHRIDKDTTGLLLIAKNLPAHTLLVRQLQDRAISRIYLAVCNGVLTGGGTDRFAGHTSVRVSLDTGRTHQIRVHFAHRRHALVGDPVYGGRLALPGGASERLVTCLRNFKRQALHAAILEFSHPEGGQRLRLEASLPADFEDLLAALQEDLT